MFWGFAALLVGHALAACPDTAQCSEERDHAALLQVNTNFTRTRLEMTMSPKASVASVGFRERDENEGRTHTAANTRGAPTPKGNPQKNFLRDYVNTIADGSYAWQHGIHTYGKPHPTGQLLVVCLVVIIVLAVGWVALWRMTRPSAPMKSLKLLLLCCSFGACSWAFTMANKTLVQNLGTPALVTATQMFFVGVGVLLTAKSRMTGTRDQCFRWLCIPLLFGGMLVATSFSFKYLTISMIMIIRNAAPLVVLPIEIAVMAADKRPYVTSRMILALIIVLASTFLYLDNINISITGLVLALIGIVLAIADRLAQRRLLTVECKDLSIETCMFLNNAISMVPCLILAACLGEFSKVDLKDWFESLTTVLLFSSTIIGAGISYFSTAVQREISATSFMVLQNAVRMAAVVFGILCFGDPIGWPYQVLGLILSFVGAIGYGFSQLKAQAEMRAKRAREEELAKAKHGPETMRI